jgi:predicted ATPase
VLDAAQTLFATQAVEPFMVKGKSRPVTAYTVGDEIGTRPPRGLGALPFLGRDAELATVCDAVKAVCEGRGGVVAITGDAGLGKSRLLAEALATQPDLTVLEARAEPYGAATPYRPVRDPVRSLLGLAQLETSEMPSALTTRLETLAPALLPWAPLIGDVVGVPVDPTPATRDLDPQFRPERTAAAVVDLLEAGVDGPLIIAFDDAHYSDDATAGLASRVERATASHPWLLLCALREGESGGYHPGDVARVPLAPLDDEAARALVQHGTQAAPLRPHDVETVVTRAAGNPLFLEETLRNLREHGDLDSLPSSLEGMVAAQIDALPPLSRRLVRRASVLGRSFRIGVLTDLFDGEQVAFDDTTRRELADILEDDGPGRLRFRHALLRDAAYDSLPYEQRRELHLRAAQSTLTRAGANPSSAADALALHYAAGADWASTWHWARIAADQARRAYANPEAAAQCLRALDAARRLRDVTTDDVVATWESLGDARRLAGRLEEALDAYRHALRLAASTEDQVRLLTLSARVRDRAGKQPAAHRDLTRAERLAASLADLDRDRAMASVRSVRGTVLFEQERYAAAERQARQAIAAARGVGDQDALANSLNNRGSALVMLGRGGDEAETSLREALAIYDELGDLANQAEITMNLGGMAWFAGRWQDAADLYRAAVQSALRAGAVVPAALAQANLGELLIAQGHAQEAVTVLGASLATLQAVGFTHAAFAESQLGRAHAVLGDLDEAERLRAHLMSSGTPPVDVVDLAIAVAEAEVDAGDVASALEVLETTTAAIGDVGVYAAALARVRARALAHLGRHDEAARSIDEGIEQCDVYGLGYERALLRLAEQELRRTADERVDDAEVSTAAEALRALDVTESYIEALVRRVS